ncbi:MAG: hypothetical protein Kow0010_11200 [Dehalococcoidia bacterium]
MTLEELIIAVVRVVGSLFVLRWAFVGGIVAILIDFSDLFMKNLLDLGGVRDYQAFDKWLDQVYQFAFLAVALRWSGVARRVALVLFAYRLVGFVVFEVVEDRLVLFFFPNVFEFWFIFVASLPHWWPRFAYTRRNVAVALAALTGAKLFQEYVLHVGKWLDSFTTIDAMEWLWDAITAPFT